MVAVWAESVMVAVGAESVVVAVGAESIGATVGVESIVVAVISESIGVAVGAESIGVAVGAESIVAAVRAESIVKVIDNLINPISNEYYVIKRTYPQILMRFYYIISKVSIPVAFNTFLCFNAFITGNSTFAKPIKKYTEGITIDSST